MDIYSDTGYLIIMDPIYFQLADKDELKSFDFLQNPDKAAYNLEKKLFPHGGTDKIGLIKLTDGPGKYNFDLSQVSFWDVDDEDMTGRTIFGVELGTFIIFDIKYIKDIAINFNKLELEKYGGQKYFNLLNQKLSTKGDVILWAQSHVGIGDGWHEVRWQAFNKY